MKLSVIVPVYRAETTLRKCVDSLLAQTLSDLEIILVNDGSPDGSQAVMDEYAARFPDKVRTRTVSNGGQGRARNIGIDMARGEWLGFVDSDDWILPEMYEKMIAAAVREQTDLAVCQILNCYADGRTEVDCFWQTERPMTAAGSASDKVFRRSLIEDLRFPEGLWYEDFAFSALALSRAGRFAGVREALYCYRIGHSSTMHNDNARKNLDMLAVLDLLRQPMLDAGREKDYASLVLNHALLDTINRVRQQNSPDKETVIKEIRSYVNQQIPNLLREPAFREESRNRRIVMWLNYHGRDKLSAALFKLKNGE